MAEGNHVSADAKIAELEQKLSAKEKTLRVLIARVEGQIDNSNSALVLMQENRALELAVEFKTAQLGCERQKLESALRDLQQIQAELLQTSKLTAIGQLAAGIAHEINTPMQFVGDNTHFVQRAFQLLLPIVERMQQLAAKDDSSSSELVELKQMLKRARVEHLCREVPRAIDGSLEGIKRVTNIVRAMKEFSHPSDGHRQPVNLNDAIQSTIEVTRNAWKYVATVETDFDPELPLVPCLRDEINQVVLNLIVNAADAVGDATQGGTNGKASIVISTRKTDQAVRVSVADSGSGIPEAIRTRVFEPFFTTKGVGKGTGQGLAIAYSVITDKHHGKIWLAAQESAGAAALLADVGILALAVFLPAGWPESDAELSPERERAAYGCTHAEVSAYLLALWALPDRVVRAVLAHHEALPPASDEIDVGTAVALAYAVVDGAELPADWARARAFAEPSAEVASLLGQVRERLAEARQR